MKPNPRVKSKLNVSMFGGVVVTYSGLEVRLHIRKMQALLAFLILEGKRCSRDMLIGRLWSDVPEANARASLRQAVYQLRKDLSELGCDYLDSDKLGVGLSPENVETDIDAVVRAADADVVHSLLLKTPRLTETLLVDLEDVDPSFQDWLRAKRQILHDQVIRALEQAARRAQPSGPSRTDFAQALLNLDPTHEEACRILMRARAENGDIAGALRVYKTLWDLLSNDHDMEPAEETQRLVAEIKSGILVPSLRLPAAAPADPDHQERVSLLIHPFQTDGVRADNVHLVHGFRHHLIASLVKFREWYVTDKAVQQPATSARPNISSEYELDATVVMVKSTVRIVLTLKEAGRDIFIWSDSYELDLKRWFDTQQTVVRRVASSLNVHTSQARLARLSSQPDVSLVAYDRWLRGQAIIMGFSSESWASAERLFRQTIAEAPNFSSAYSSLAQINNLAHIAQPGVYRTRERERETIELGRAAVRFDPLDSRAHLSLGWAYMMAKQYDQAPTHFDLACQLNENDPWTLISASLSHSFTGSFDRSKALAQSSFKQALFPTRSMWGYDVTSRFLWGDYEGCIAASTHAEDIIPNLSAWTAAAFHHLGKPDKARDEAKKFVERARARWRGTETANEAAIARWLLHLFPIARRKDWERLRDGIEGAGLPKGTIAYNEW